MADQKHYPMPELSEQERNSAIELAKFKLANGAASVIDKIALAALTAEPVAFTSQVNLDEISSKQAKKLEFMTGDKSVYSNPVQLYTAPPVPALNREPDYYIHRVEFCDSYGPDVEIRAYKNILDAMKSVDDHGGDYIAVYAAPEVKNET